ncbi:MAG: stress response translation initiation inhibitor YciH [Cellvibrionaceae bacterium]
MKKKDNNSRLVYSTETGRIKSSKQSPALSTDNDGIVRLLRENRKGSGVTLIKGLPPAVNIKALAKTLKKKLGVGGSIKEGVIEIQTDQREKVKELLEKQGHQVKIAGG